MNKNRKSFRLQTWDYGKDGAYFITICTKNKVQYFGEITEKKVYLNEIGSLAEKYWLEIPTQFPYVKLSDFVIMPDHMHGILIIDKSVVNIAGARLIAPLRKPHQTGGFAGDKNPMFHQNISRVCRWYKGRCAFEIRKINPNFEWQSLFYDQIIWDNKLFEKIQWYIKNNPAKWESPRLPPRGRDSSRP